MNRRFFVAFVLLVLPAVPAQALIDKCKVKVGGDGALLVSASVVAGSLLHDADRDGVYAAVDNEIDCLAAGKAKSCRIGADGSLEARTPPSDCQVPLRDNDGDFLCPHYRGCVVGLREGAVGPTGPTGPGSIIGGFDLQFSEDDRSGWTHLEFLSDDACLLSIPLGFAFTGFGADTMTVSLSTNGVLFFGEDCGSSFANTTLPATITNDAALFFFWDDLRDYGTSEFAEYATFGAAGGRVFNLYFVNRLLASTCGSDQIKVMLSVHEDSNLVKASYTLATTCSILRGGAATFGLQTTGGAAATAFTVGMNSAILDDNRPSQSISFHPPR